MPIRFVDKTGQLGLVSTTLANAVSALVGTHTLPAGRTGTIGAQLGSHVSAFSGAFQENAARTGTIGATLDSHTASIIGGAPSSAEASADIRFSPGHYMYMDTGSGGGGLAGWIAQINSLSSEPTVTGVQFGTHWSSIETNTRGTYDWTILDAIVNAASAINKKVMLYVKHQYFGTSVTSPTGKFPSWLSTIQSGSPGYTAWDGVNPSSPPGNLNLVLHLWNTSVMTAWTQLGQAIANRYKDNPTFEMLSIGETSTANLPGSGYSTTAWIARLKDWMTAQRAAWPNTAIRVGTNYFDTDAQMQDVIAHAATLQITCGGPDNFSRVYQSNPIYTGFNGGIDHRDVIPWVGENQRPATSSGGTSATSAQVYAFNETGALSSGGSTKPNYYIWNRNTDSTGGAETWATHILPFIRSISGACNTTTPSSYLGVHYVISTTGSDSNDGRATTRPWAITALNTKRTAYTGKTVGLMDGTYNVKSLLDANTDIDDWALDVDGGTSAASTIIKSVNPRGAIINAKSGSVYGNTASTPLLGHSGATAHRGYVVFDGLKITGHSRLGIRIGIYAVGSEIPGVVVRNCEFTDFNGSAYGTNSGLNFEQLELNRCTGHIVQNNYFHDNIGEIAGSNDHFSAVLQWQSNQGLYEYNTVVNSGALYGKEGDQWGHTFRFNHIDNSAIDDDVSQGLFDWAGDSTDHGVATSVHHNVIVAGQVCTLIETLDETGYFPNGIECYNNTFVIKPSAASRGPVFRAAAGLMSVYNNIIVDEASGDHTYCAHNVNGPGVFNYNLYYTSGDDQWSTYSDQNDISRTTVSTFALWKAAMPAGTDLNSISGSNPLFVAAGTNAAYYDLQSGSPARNVGKTGGTSGGTTVHMGAWDGVVGRRIGCDF
jgi:hypothetical protein